MKNSNHSITNLAKFSTLTTFKSYQNESTIIVIKNYKNTNNILEK